MRTNLDNKILTLFLSFSLSFTFIFSFIYVLSWVLPEDGWITEEMRSLFLPSILREVRPEPSERSIYIWGSLLSPLFVFISFWLADSIIERNTKVNAKLLCFVHFSFSAFVGFFTWKLFQFDLVKYSFNFDFENNLLNGIVLFAGVIITIYLRAHGINPSYCSKTLRLLSTIPFARRLINYERHYPKLNVVLLIIIFLFSIVITSCWRVFSLGSVTMDASFINHFNAVIYAVSQAVAGKTVLIDFFSQYGLFAILLAPWFRWIKLSVAHFTETMAFLQIISTFCILYFVSRFIKNAFLFFLCAAFVLVGTSLWYKLVFPNWFDPYFQYSPVRLLFPATALCVFYLQRKSSTLFNLILVSIFCAVGMIWNLDSGVAVAGTWIAILVFDIVEWKVKKESCKIKLLNLITSVTTIFLFILLFLITYFYRSLGIVSFTDLFRYQNVYYVYGVAMLPMPTDFHPWMYVIGIYVLGLTLGIGKIIGKWKDEIFWHILVLSVLGIGLFSYYQGRSHDHVLMAVVWPAILILFLFFEKCLRLIRDHRLGLWAILPLGIFVTIGILVPMMLLNGVPMLMSVTRDNANRFVVPKSSIAANSKFIAENLNGKSECAIFTKNYATYFAENGLASVLKGASLREIVLRAEKQKIDEQLQYNPPQDIFVEPSYFEESQSNPDFIQLVPLLSSSYDLKAVSPSGDILYYKRKVNGND